MGFKVVTSMILAAILAGAGVTWLIERKALELAAIEMCREKSADITRTSQNLERAKQTVTRAKARLHELNPDSLSEFSLNKMKTYQRNLELEKRYSSFANAVFTARAAVEKRYSINLTSEPFDKFPGRSRADARELFFAKLQEAGFPSERTERQALARELQAFLREEIGKAPGAGSVVNVVVIPSVKPEAIAELLRLFVRAEGKAVFQRDEATRNPSARSLQGEPNLASKIGEYEARLRVIETVKPELETAVDHAQSTFWETQTALNQYQSDFSRLDCRSVLRA